VKSRIQKYLKNLLLSLLLVIGPAFPTSGIIKECDDTYDNDDDIQMFI